MKKRNIIILIIIILLLQGIMIFYSYHSKFDNIIPTNYQVVFKGETGEAVYSTYLYSKKKGKKISYSYINTNSTLSSYDSSLWNEEIINKGKLKNIDDIFSIAQENNAYSYVLFEDGKILSIEEFKKTFK